MDPKTNPSSSISSQEHHDTHEGELDSSSAQKKRHRQIKSCKNCRRRRIKCSKIYPCSSCAMRKEVCEWEDLPPIELNEPSFQELVFEIERLQTVVINFAQRLEMPSDGVHNLLFPSRAGGSPNPPSSPSSSSAHDPHFLHRDSDGSTSPSPERSGTKNFRTYPITSNPEPFQYFAELSPSSSERHRDDGDSFQRFAEAALNAFHNNAKGTSSEHPFLPPKVASSLRPEEQHQVAMLFMLWQVYSSRQNI